MADVQQNYQIYIGAAREMLQVAKENFMNFHFSSACNRAYYACFYAVSALLLTKNLTFSKHSAVLAAFRQHFIKTGEFDPKWGKIYEMVMASRQSSDYDLFTQIDEDQALFVVERASEFVNEIEKWLLKRNLI
ncbi:MAG: HEPN domain-containing protein [Anaerolineales bacterium]|nr:HEPN domain-containing protein [Anaerolineales bacterium]